MKRKLVGLVGSIVVLSFFLLVTFACQLGAAPPDTGAEVTPPPRKITAEGLIVPELHSRLALKASGKVSGIPADAGSQVKAGQVLIKLDAEELEAQVAIAEAGVALSEAQLAQMRGGPRSEEIAIAQANVKATQAKLAQVTSPRSERIAIAQANLRSAEAQLAELLAGATPSQIAAAEAALAKAKNNLCYQQAVRDSYNNISPPYYTRDQGEALLGIAYEDVQAAEAALEGLKAPARQEKVNQLEAAVEAARQQLRLAQEVATPDELAELRAAVEAAEARDALARSPYTARDLEIAQTRVKQAKAALDQAKVALKSAVLTAPYAGTVVDVLVKPGEMVLAGTPVVVLADLSELRVETRDLEEGDLGSLSIGQKVSVTVNAFEDKVLSGKITDIALQATLTSAGDANFKITIAFDQQDPFLRWGMTTKVEFSPE